MNPDDNNESRNHKVSISKILGVNLLIVLFVTMFVNATPSNQGSGFVFFNFIFVGAQCAICIAIGAEKLNQKNLPEGQAYLLAGLVVLIVGFSSCLGGHALLS